MSPTSFRIALPRVMCTSFIIFPQIQKVKSYDSTENDLFVIRIILRVVVFAVFGDEDCVDVGKGVDELHALLKT